MLRIDERLIPVCSEIFLMVDNSFDSGLLMIVDVSLLEHIEEKPVLQNNINYCDIILNCNLLDLINVRVELEVIPDRNEENQTEAYQRLISICTTQRIDRPK